jgi:hypothetical protein
VIISDPSGLDISASYQTENGLFEVQ